MTTALDRLALDYRVAFLRYLPRRQETALHSGYELGREAVMAGVSVLDIARVHHEVFLEVLRDTRDEDPTALATAASEFFLEVLSTFDMSQRGYLAGKAQGGTPPARGHDADRPVN